MFKFTNMKNWLLLFLFPSLFLFSYLISENQSFLNQKAILTLFISIWMIGWWVFEVLPLGITALLPLILLPTLKIMPLNEVSAKYANPVIFLFLGGFMIARALEKTELNKRISLYILNITGKSDKGIVLGFVIATAFLSMWISNTASTVMMLPIAISVMDFLKQQKNINADSLRSMTTVTFLSIAYSANIGGIATPIGTPPNVVLVGYLNDTYNLQIDFWRWVAVLLPVVIVILTFQFFLLNKLFPYQVKIDKEFRKFVKTQIISLGPYSISQKIVLATFIFTCTLWITKDLWNHFLPSLLLNDTSIAIMGGTLLFLFPTSLKEFKCVLQKSDIQMLPWNIVLLFGGGIALADSIEKAGFIKLATQFVANLQISEAYLVILIIALICILLTEVMSNVALCVVALPVILKLSSVYNVSPIIMSLPAAVAASMAFTMPISTPPNAIVFGTNQIKMKDMVKAGSIMNIISLFVLMTLGWFLMKLLLSA